MHAHYDLVVVGGGTSGLEAAKTAAQAGLRVALLERKTSPDKIQRSCAQMFLLNMDSFYNEHMYFSREQKKWIFPANNFSVNYPGEYREFYGLHFVAPNARDRIEFGDYEKNASGQGTAAVVFDKGALLGGLFREGRAAGVEYFLERNVVSARKQGNAVEIKTAEGDTFRGTFCIAADGVNSRLARCLGLNRTRAFVNTGRANSYYITGVQFDRSEMISLGLCFAPKPQGTIMFSMLPSVYREDEYWLYIVGPERLEYLTRHSPFQHWFSKVEITHQRCAVVSNWEPAKDPFLDNVLFVGDSCWFAEAENTGALLSGHKAAMAVCTALHTGRINREGVGEYISWWKHNWLETHDYREFVCYPVFNRMFSEDEHNYIHNIIRQKLPWSLNPFLMYRKIVQGLAPHMETIARDRPALAQKIRGFKPETALRLMKPAARQGYPCY
jgi:flavin-dependent dehydrogenase